MKKISKNLFLLFLGSTILLVFILSFLFIGTPKQRAANIPGRSSIYSLAYDTMVMLSNSGPETLNVIKTNLGKKLENNKINPIDFDSLINGWSDLICRRDTGDILNSTISINQNHMEVGYTYYDQAGNEITKEQWNNIKSACEQKLANTKYKEIGKILDKMKNGNASQESLKKLDELSEQMEKEVASTIRNPEHKYLDNIEIIYQNKSYNVIVYAKKYNDMYYLDLEKIPVITRK